MADVLPILLAAALIVVFAGMAALVWRSISAIDALAQLALKLASPQPVPAATPVHVPAALPPAPAPAALPKPTVAPAPSGPFAGAPPWFIAALHEIGFHETGNNQGIERYIAMAHCGSVGDPWCAIFANAMLESVGVPGTRSASSQSFRTDQNFVSLSAPVLGCIVVFWRISKSSGQGHVGFYRGEDASRVWTLGGNENDMVQIEALPKDSASFGLIGYFWPKGVAVPTTGPVMMSASSQISVQVPPAGIAPAVPAAPAQSTEFGAMVAGGYFSSSPFDKSIPASIRTNNPGALNVAPWIRNAPGYVGDKVTSMSGAEANSTVIFSTPEYGVAAWFTLLQKYRAAGATTLSAIINRYGGGQNYSSYVAEVAAWSGIGEPTEIKLDDDAMLLAFGKAMFRYEAGRPSPLSDAQILYGFNLARGTAATVPPAPPAATAASPPNVV